MFKKNESMLVSLVFMCYLFAGILSSVKIASGNDEVVTYIVFFIVIIFGSATLKEIIDMVSGRKDG